MSSNARTRYRLGSFAKRTAPGFAEVTPADHGRIKTRRIWCSTALNAYLDFPGVRQVFVIEPECIEKKTASTPEIALGITSHTPATGLPAARTNAQSRALGHRAADSRFTGQCERRWRALRHRGGDASIRPKEHAREAAHGDRHFGKTFLR